MKSSLGRTLLAGALSLGLGAATLAPAQAAAPTSGHGVVVAAAKAKTLMSVKTTKKSFHRGGTGPLIKIAVKKGSKAAKGKVVIYDGKKKVKTITLKKGKAYYRIPFNVKAGKHTYTVKYGKTVRRVKVTVYNSSLKVNRAKFVISKSDPYGYKQADPAAYQAQSALKGTVKYKGKWAKQGWVDIYRNGNVKGGSASPDYLTMDSVSKGRFDFGNYWLTRVASKYPVGTYKFKVFYTPNASFADYIHSSWVVVKVVK